MKNCHFLFVALSVVAIGSQCANAQHSIEPIDNNPVTRADVEKLLKLPWPDLQLKPEISLAEAMEDLVEAIVKESGTSVSVWSDKLELELESVNSLEDVMVTNIDLRAGSVTIKQGLRYILVRPTHV